MIAPSSAAALPLAPLHLASQTSNSEPITDWAFAPANHPLRFFKGWVLGLLIGLLLASITCCWLPCLHYHYADPGEPLHELILLGLRIRLQPRGGFQACIIRRLRMFFLGQEESTATVDRHRRSDDLEAGIGIELEGRRNQAQREQEQEQEQEQEEGQGQQTLPEPTVPDFRGSYMFSAATATPSSSTPAQPQQQQKQQQQSYGCPVEQQRVRDKFRLERERIQRAVAEERREAARRSTIQQSETREHAGPRTTLQQDAVVATLQREMYPPIDGSQITTAQRDDDEGHRRSGPTSHRSAAFGRSSV